ncbi:MAG: phosphodiesterase [Ilumatobacteraceae bacterium]
MENQVLLAQLSDTHVLEVGAESESGVDHNARLAEAVAALDAENPAVDAILATGDLVDDEQPGQYAALSSLVAPLAAPVLAIPGNHDTRDGVRQTFPDLPWVDADHASWVVVVADRIRVVGLDSTVPGERGAEFDAGREDWLRSTLAASHDGPTVLAIHHPPFRTGIGWMDRSGFLGLERLVEVLHEHPVDRVVCGHLHRPITSSVAGIPAQVGLSTVEHVALDLAPGAGVALVREPVGYQLHHIVGRDVTTHTRYIDNTEEPYRPAWAADLE